MSKPDCSKCSKCRDCNFKKRNEVCWEFPYIGEKVYTWFGSYSDM